MAQRNSADAVFRIDNSSGTIKDISAHVTSVDGLPGVRDLNEVTPLGQSGRKYSPGLENATFTVEGVYDDSTTDDTSPKQVLQGLRAAAATASFEYWPGGRVAGRTEHSGEAWMRNYTEPIRAGDMVLFRAELQVDGVVTTDLDGTT